MYSSTHGTISKGTTETLTLTLSGFTPNSTVNIKGHNTSPALNNGQDYITVNENVTVNSSGSYREKGSDGQYYPRLDIRTSTLLVLTRQVPANVMQAFDVVLDIIGDYGEDAGGA